MAAGGEQNRITMVALAALPAWTIVRAAGASAAGVGNIACNLASLSSATFSAGAIGVTQLSVVSGDAVPVAYLGESKVVAGAALGVGVLFTNNGSGRAAASVSGDLVVGRVMEAATNDGDVIRCLLFPVYRTV